MKKIISFSLYGNKPNFQVGAVVNVLEAKRLYPDWKCRFYTTDDEGICKQLEYLGAEIVRMDDWLDGEMFWRFLAIDDADICISRDADSTVNEREVGAVNEWLESDYQWHSMHDHKNHRKYSIMGGMWGCKQYGDFIPESIAQKVPEEVYIFDFRRKSMREHINEWIESGGKTVGRNWDQIFLGYLYENKAQTNIMWHGSWVNSSGNPFPDHVPCRYGNFVGDYSFWEKGWKGFVNGDRAVSKLFTEKNLPPKQHSEGFVSFINENKQYIDLLDVCIDSVLEFTDKKFEVFSMGFEYSHPSNSDRIIVRTLEPRNNFAEICYQKLFAAANCSFDKAIMLDSDMIVAPNVVNLFDKIDLNANYPLGSLHPTDPNDQRPIMDVLNVKRKTQPYIHATFLFNKNCADFFNMCYEFSQEARKKGYKIPHFDETILNVMLWKAEQTKSYVDTYDPYYEVFLDSSTESRKRHGYHNLKSLDRYICHGCKDPQRARDILNLIRTQSVEAAEKNLPPKQHSEGLLEYPKPHEALYNRVLDRVIMSCDSHPNYLDFWPLAAAAWDKMGVKTTLIVVERPEENIQVDESIGDVIRLELQDESIHTAFAAQAVRLLAPCLYPDENITLADIDIIPLNKEYFFKNLCRGSEDSFIEYRHGCVSSDQVAMCWNAAKGSVWSDIFGISATMENYQDVFVDRLKEWNPQNYKPVSEGVCNDWFTDQKLLYKYLSAWSGKHVKLTDHICGHRRLDHRIKHIPSMHDNYTDFCPRRPVEHNLAYRGRPDLDNIDTIKHVFDWYKIPWKYNDK